MTAAGRETARLIERLTDARTELFAALRRCEPGMYTAPAQDRGWSVRQVCEHLVNNENFFVRQLAAALEADVWSSGRAQLPSLEEAVSSLIDSREMLLWVLEDVTDAELRVVRRGARAGEFTVEAVVEQLIAHDEDHAEQIRTTLAAHRPQPRSLH